MRAFQTLAHRSVQALLVACALALHMQAAQADEKLERFCVGPGAAITISASDECAAAFAHALNAVDDPEQVVVTATAVSTLKGVEPLRFQKRAPWVRRLEAIGKEGIAFVRVPRGQDRELVIGISRRGVLGVQLKQVANR